MPASYTNNLTPKLRPIDAQPFVQNGQPALLLRDPLQLSGNYLVLPQELGPVLGLFRRRSRPGRHPQHIHDPLWRGGSF